MLLFKKFLPIADICLSCEDTARQSLQWCRDGDFFASCISASRVHYAIHFRPAF